ncbi:Na+/H+ antiporter NhaA [Campylobacter insulaenigrae]|uniref:Na+/H+ antiporter NhaA n=1 Tax=Campylobacter insulaenigrae TaxID=260714 RepID=UPI002152834C|nr:Na+/H+ antiporter NhaA [Campylobacter insulaenigrae]MCR6575766.1 Na+/H+ antiporter NhaA [Campylobacter insulaenigrae]MCR6577569.1 Na+/H+ antiporter NhaA [Campylobacter insulaenigrae]
MQRVQNFVKSETFPGVLLIFFTVLALILQNSSLTDQYTNFLNIPFGVQAGNLEIFKPLILWINDGLIAIFFFAIGLELKYEITRGQLNSIKAMSLPIFAALGGMIVPAVIFAFFNYQDDFALQGWAIPTATDVAFAVGILMLLGNKIPISLKLFLLSLAIFDDLGAIIVIALFYTSELSVYAMIAALVCIFALYLLNHFHITKKSFYIVVAIIFWISMLKSGVHATLAGVITALFIPLDTKSGQTFLKNIEHDLTPWVTYFILPIFAFANAGVDLKDMDPNFIFSSVSLGIILGLFLGKQIGVFIFSYISIKLGLAKLPKNTNFKQLYGVCILTGIGFTMSFFIDGLAYQNSDVFAYSDKLAILIASFLSAVVGYFYLKIIYKNKKS